MLIPSHPKQLKQLTDFCAEKESCSIEATRDTFGDEECPGEPDENMYLWLTYRCIGNKVKDNTKISGPRKCKPKPTPTEGRYVLTCYPFLPSLHRLSKSRHRLYWR